MKILLTADPEIPVPPIHYGGIERIVDSLVKGFVAKGHDVTLIAHCDSKVPGRLVKWKGTRSGGLKNTLVNTNTLLRHVLSEHYDVLHSFSRLAYLTPLLPTKLPKIMSYQREPTLSQIRKAAQLARKDTLLFTGCSNYITNQIKPVVPARTVYNFVPISQYKFSATVSDDAPLTFLGRIEPIKGTHIAVEVAQKTGRPLLIAGNIPAEGVGYFEKKIQPHLTDRIQYIGPVNDVQKAAMLGKSAAFLMPIEWNEPFGIVMAEAMACGTPVLGFPLGSVPEVVEDGINGFICKDVKEMVERVGQLQVIDRKKVRESAEQRFSDAVIVEEYLDLYQQHIEKNLVPVRKVY